MTAASLAAKNAATEAPTAEDVALFESIMNAEAEVKISRNLRGISSASASSLRKETDRLFAKIDSLTPRQQRLFGAYRMSH